MNDYPRMLYGKTRVPRSFRVPGPEVYGVIAEDKEEQDKLVNAGYALTAEEAVNPKKPKKKAAPKKKTATKKKAS